jgi:hypothetical protein
MSEFMALEVRSEEAGEDREAQAMAREAAARAIADKVIAARSGTKLFHLEQRNDLEILSAEFLNSLKDDEREEQKKIVLEKIRFADEKASDADTEEFVRTQRTKQVGDAHKYQLSKKLEYAVDSKDDEIVPMTRKEYVFWFRAQQRKSAKAALEMCRTVYEAYKTLNDSEFASFCVDIGHKDDSSTVRKFIAIGKVYPRLIGYADQLPAAWTSIYLLTQIPAHAFEICIKKEYELNRLTGGELKQLIDKTKDVNNLVSPFRQDKKQLAYPVAKVFFTKRPDDIDFRLLQKALEEVQARLPVKFQFIGEQVKVFKERTAQRYEAVMQEGELTAVKPSEWDYGSAANDVHKDKPVAA